LEEEQNTFSETVVEVEYAMIFEVSQCTSESESASTSGSYPSTSQSQSNSQSESFSISESVSESNSTSIVDNNEIYIENSFVISGKISSFTLTDKNIVVLALAELLVNNGTIDSIADLEVSFESAPAQVTTVPTKGTVEIVTQGFVNENNLNETFILINSVGENEF
jgi:hypothetical protein